MKIVKIGAIWCGGCLVMNKVWNRLKKEYSFEFVELDYDMDEEEVQRYNPGNILPVLLFFKDNHEVLRLQGEYSYDEIIQKMNEEGVLND